MNVVVNGATWAIDSDHQLYRNGTLAIKDTEEEFLTNYIFYNSTDMYAVDLEYKWYVYNSATGLMIPTTKKLPSIPDITLTSAASGTFLDEYGADWFLDMDHLPYRGNSIVYTFGDDPDSSDSFVAANSLTLRRSDNTVYMSSGQRTYYYDSATMGFYQVPR